MVKTLELVTMWRPEGSINPEQFAAICELSNLKELRIQADHGVFPHTTLLVISRLRGGVALLLRFDVMKTCQYVSVL